MTCCTTQADTRARAARGPSRAGWFNLRVRPIRREDTTLLTDMFSRLSPISREARFLYRKTDLTPTELRYFTDVDHHNHEALITVTRWGSEPVGVARFIRNREEPTTAEIAVTVVDEWQNRGVGSMLATRLSWRALGVRITHFTALASVGNHRARRLLAKLGDVAVVGRDGATISYRVALPGPASVPTRSRLTMLAPADAVPWFNAQSGFTQASC